MLPSDIPSKIWPQSILFLLRFWAHDWVSIFFETLCMNETIYYASLSSSWWSASSSDLTLEMMYWVTGYHPFVMRGLRRCTRDAWREGSTLKITITFYCSCITLHQLILPMKWLSTVENAGFVFWHGPGTPRGSSFIAQYMGESRAPYVTLFW